MENRQKIEDDIKAVIIESLNLEDYTIADIKSEEPLFSEGLGLDSIDALELGIAIKKFFNIEIDVESEVREHFYSVETLANFIQNTNAEVAIEK